MTTRGAGERGFRDADADGRREVGRALKALAGHATRGDLIMATGLPRSDVDAALAALMAEGRVEVSVSESAVLVYRLHDRRCPAEADVRVGSAAPSGVDRRRSAPTGHGGGAPRSGRRWSLTRLFRPRPPTDSFDRKTLRLIRARGGVISLAELVEHTGLSVGAARREIERLAQLYGGEAHPSWDGHVVHAFPDLVESSHGDFHVREPRPAWVRNEDPMAHRTTFFAITGGLLRRLVRHPLLSVRRTQTLRRYVLGYVFETALKGKGVVSLDRTVSYLTTRTHRRRISRRKVEKVLRGLASEFDAPVSELNGDLFFGFRNVKRQFLASHVQRVRLHLGRQAEGRTVFDSGDSETVAAERELETWDRAFYDEPGPDRP